MSNHCSICKNDLSDYVTVHDDRYGYPGDFNYLKCSHCSHVELSNKIDDKKISQLYSEYYPRKNFDINDFRAKPELSLLKTFLQGEKSSAFRWVPPKVSVLDIGCGFGATVAYHEKRDCDAHGIDPDQYVLRIKEKYGHNLKCGLFSAKEYSDKTFDYITLDQVLEHTNNPEEFLNEVRKVIKTNGTCIVTLPNYQGIGRRLFNTKWIHWHAPYHVQFFSPKSFKALVEKAGFKVEHTYNITNSAWYFYQFLHLIFYPKKGSKSAFWDSSKKNSSVMRKVQKKCVQLLNKIHFFDIFARLCDCLNIGDNHVYILKVK